MSKFKVGDRVLAVDNVGEYKTPAPGTVIRLYRSTPVVGAYDYMVRYDNGPKLWSNVTGLLREKHPVIVITTDGVTTTATKRLGKKFICTATARCSDDDTFDFNTSAGLAFQRLREKEKPVPKETPWPEKLVCVEANKYPEDFRIGRVYNVEHWADDYGLLRLKNGSSWGLRRHSDTEFRINMFPDYARFIPLVED